MKIIDVCCCFYFIFTFSFYRVININKMAPKKKQNLYTSFAEQRQLLEHFYNYVGDKPFLIMNLVLKEKMKEIFLALLQTDVDVSDKDTDCASQAVDEEDLVPRKQKFKSLGIVFDLKNYNILSPQIHITFYYSDALKKKDNL